VKGAVVIGRSSPPACLVLWCSVIALGATTAEAAGIGVYFRVHAQNIPRAVAGGHNPTRSIRLDTAGESTAIKSRK
jgi:hypothetical protein